jgi:hypothetical protein
MAVRVKAPPLLDHEDPVLLHPGLQGAVGEGAVGQSEHQGVAGHGRPEVPVGLHQVLGEHRHEVILTTAAERLDCRRPILRFCADNPAGQSVAVWNWRLSALWVHVWST